MERLIRRYEMQAGEMGFPTGIFRDRALEGAAKGASPSDIEAALKARLEHLSRADEILSAAEPGRGHSEIVYACMVLLVSAFESGVSPHVFDGLFAPGRRGLSHRVQAIIEAAEFLHLSGIREVEMRAFVDDAGTRELRRMEVLRAARLWVSLSREGHDTEEIRERLWHSTPDDRPRRGGGGGPMNGGRRRGPGAGQQGRRDARP